MALALALDATGQARRAWCCKTPCRRPTRRFPASTASNGPADVAGPADAAVVARVQRPRRARKSPGSTRYFVINIDHHLGNTMYGARELVRRVRCRVRRAGRRHHRRARRAPGRPTSRRTSISRSRPTPGGFRYGPISARTFDLCRRIAATGVDHGRSLSRQIFDSFSLGRVRLTGALLNAMELHHDNRLARALARRRPARRVRRDHR